ncbi:MAG: DUF3237 domain-containing protein [Acidimicrobiales bacterium]
MIELVPLYEATLTLAPPIDAGMTPTGQLLVVEATGARLRGRLSGSLAGSSSADWVTITPGGFGLLDVRFAIRTDDDALVFATYSGRIHLVPGSGFVAYVAPTFTTGDPRYAWINEIQAVGKGVLSEDLMTLTEDVYEIS